MNAPGGISEIDADLYNLFLERLVESFGFSKRERVVAESIDDFRYSLNPGH